MAELAPRIRGKRPGQSDRVVIETVVAKYCDHLPLYRQEAMIEREAGVEISRATLDGWVVMRGWASCFSPWPMPCERIYCANPIYRLMRRSFRCRCTMGEAPITRLIL